MRRRRKKKENINLSSVLIILFLILGVVFFKFLSFKNIIIEPAFPELKSTIGQNKLSYFFNRTLLANKIFSAYPEIIRIKFKPNYFNSTLKINFATEKIIATICSSECLNLGEHRYVFQNNSAQQNDFPIISNLEIYDNSVLEQNVALVLSKIFEFSNLKSILLKNAEILTNKDIKIKTKDGWYVLIDPNQNIEKQIKKLNFFLENKKNVFATLKYIDLRIPQKIYYQ